MTVSKDCERYAQVERALEQLPLGAVSCANLLDLDEGNGLIGGVAE